MRPRPSLSRSLLRVLGLALLAAALLPVPAVLAQDEEPPQDDAAAEAEAPEDGDVPDIEAILEGDEAVLGGGGYTYDPGDRRDPFKSLLQARDNDEPQGPRPDGIPGLLIDEVTISGIFRTPRGWVAQVQAANQNKSYLIKVDDQLYDGDVLSISRNEVVFKQIVQDPTALKPFREVVKKLNP